MDTFSDRPSIHNIHIHSSSPHDMRQHLQTLLDGKEKQLQQAAALGERLLAQRVELEERVRLLQEMDADKTDEITADMRERYRELADAVRTWDFGNGQLTATFTSAVGIFILFPYYTAETFCHLFAFLGALSSFASAVTNLLLPRRPEHQWRPPISTF
jgi:hypothetical protein